MNDVHSEPSFRTALARSASFLSLAATIYCATLLLPSIRSGLYGGTAVLVELIAFGQLVALLIGVVIPSVIRVSLTRPRLSRATTQIAWAAAIGLALEILCLFLIPVSGNC